MKYIFFSFFVLFLACQSKEEPKFLHPDEISNPNGDSELALIMRYMHHRTYELKSEMESNVRPDLDSMIYLAKKIKTAEPSAPLNRDSMFMELTDNFIARIEAVKGPRRYIEYNNMVMSCVACHNTTCPGPIKKILDLKSTDR